MIIIECTNGDVRLVGGEYENEGTVEVCYNNLWGQISDNGMVKWKMQKLFVVTLDTKMEVKVTPMGFDVIFDFI